MQGIMGAFLDGMQNVVALVAHPINPFTHRIGRRQFIILNIVLGLVFLFLVDLRFQILRLGLVLGLVLVLVLVLFLLFVLPIECLLKPRPSHLTGDDPFAIGMVRVFLQ